MMAYQQPGSYDCGQCGGTATYPDPHRSDCIFKGAGEFAMSPVVATCRREIAIAERMTAMSEILTDSWQDLCQALLQRMAELLTGIDQAAMGRVPA